MEFDHSTDTILPDDQPVLTIGGTGGMVLPSGTTAQRPSTPPLSTTRWNTDLGSTEMYVAASTWILAGTVTAVGVTSNGTYAGALTVGSSPVTQSGTITLTPNVFGTATPGVVPSSGGGTTNFLRADGTWAAPGGGGATNLAYNTPTNTVTSDTGTDATIPLFTSAQAGLAPASGGGASNYMCANGNWTAPPGVTNIGYTPSTRTVTSDTGTDAVLPLFTGGQDGMTPQSGGGTTNFLRADGTWVAPTASAAPAGNDKEVQYNNAGTTAGAANVEIDNGDLCLVLNASPVTPPANNVKMFGRKLAQRMLPASVGPAGLDAVLQPATWRQKIGIWTPPGNATTVPGVVGTTAWTAVGTATARNVATTNLLTRMRRLGYVSAATAGSLTSIRTATAQYTTGTGAGLGGFFASFRFAITDVAAVSGARFFAGFSSTTTAPTNTEPSALTNVFGVAQLSTSSTQLYFVYGGSAAQTAVALGTGFPPMASAGIANGVPYDLTLFCPPSGNGVVHYELFRLDTDTSIAGTITPGTPGTQTPANTTLLNPVMWRCNNATALAVGMDLCNFYIETDY